MIAKKNKSNIWSGFGRQRLQTHLGLLVFSLLGCGLAYLYEPASLLNDIVALGTAYVALVLLVATLSIGPLNLLLKRRNPVNLDLRRDIGIWAGITGCIHAFFSLQLYSKGDILLYFFNKGADGSYTPQFNLFGLSNLTGLLATLVLLVLLVFSNNLSLRWLKGKSWKFVQRFNYPLFILVVVHTIGYIVLNGRESFFSGLLVGLVFFTAEAQLIGVVLYRSRERKREAAARGEQLQTAPITVGSGIEREQSVIARRRFLVLSGVTILTGVSSVVALGAALKTQNDTTAVQPQAAASTQPTSGVANSNPTATGSTNPITSANGQTTPVSGAVNSDTPATGNANPGGTNSNGTVLASLSSLPVGAAITFTTPDTGESAFLIHEQDGSIKAFSNICTHRPYELTYQQNRQSFFCELHAASFNVTSGAVTRGPARTGLASFKVQADSSGNIVYIQQ